MDRGVTRVSSLRDGVVVEHRVARSGGDAGTVLVMHGGHMRAELDVDDATWLGMGLDLVVPSRPGYGRTTPEAGPGPERFADNVCAVLDELGIGQLRAVVGISAGTPSALALAQRHPDRVERVESVSGVSPILPWPDRRTRIAGRVVFNRWTERATWALTRWSLQRWPDPTLRSLFGALTTGSAAEVVASLTREQHSAALELFGAMRSGRGFTTDLRQAPRPDIAASVRQPTLVVATRCDASVPFDHAEALARTVPGAVLAEVEAVSHLLWIDPDADDVRARIREFVLAGP